MWSPGVSPFVTDGPVAPAEVVGRERELRVLKECANAGRSVVLLAPRRYGKTSLVGRVSQDLDRARSMTPVAVDLFGVVSLADLVVRLEDAYRRHLVGRTRRLVQDLFDSTAVGLSLGGAGFGLQISRNPDTDPLPALHTLLDLPARLHQKRRVLVVFDEFQALARVNGAEAILRSHVQHHREAASYIYAGSEPGMLEAMFSTRNRAFYTQADLKRLGPLPAGPVRKYLVRRFGETGRDPAPVLDWLMEASGGHPQRTMLLADCLWRATRPDSVSGIAEWAAAYREATDRVSIEHEATWRSMTITEQRVVRALVEGWPPAGRSAQEALALPKGSVAETVRRLVDTGLLEREPGDRPRLVDPLYRRWVLDRFGLTNPGVAPRTNRSLPSGPPADT